jgi:hypothetical protein
MPGHSSREVLIIFSSLTTCDPANIYELVKVTADLSVSITYIQAVSHSAVIGPYGIGVRVWPV